MKILVLGAGAIGGYFGGRLAAAGTDVTFLVRGRRAEQLAQQGLRVTSRFGDIRMPVRCTTQDTLTSGYDMVILTAKAYDLAGAIDAIVPAMAGGGAVLALLNGISHLDTLAARFGRARVLGSAAYIAATVAADGEIRHLNEFQRLVFGPLGGASGPDATRVASLCKSLVAEFARTPVEVTLAERIEQEMWDKWVFLASLAGMTCLMRANIGDIVSTDAGERLTLAFLAECAAVARAAGYPTGEAQVANARRMLTQRGSTFSASMLRDAEAGGPTEADHILGEMLARARQHGVAAPLLEVAVTHMQCYAERRRRESGGA